MLRICTKKLEVMCHGLIARERVAWVLALAWDSVVFLDKTLNSHSASLHSGIIINGTGKLLGKPNKLQKVTCDGLASCLQGVDILVATSCYRNRDKRWQLQFDTVGSMASLWIFIQIAFALQEFA